MERLAVVTHNSAFAADSRQALRVKIEHPRTGREIGTLIELDIREDQVKQYQRNPFGCLRPLHRSGVPLLTWVRRRLSRSDAGRVFGKRIAFENYHPLEGCAGLPAGMTA